jgi:hypothetical protein
MRQCGGSWLIEYEKYCQGHEIPSLYHLWTGISLIACCLKQNVYIDMGSFLIYPNLYIIIVDTPSSGKSHAINALGRHILKKSEQIKPEDENRVYLFTERITNEALIQAISKLWESKKENSIYIMAPELTFFTDQENSKSKKASNLSETLILCWDNTDLGNRTISRSLDFTPNAQINILGGVTPECLRVSVNSRFITSGMLSRMVFIRSDETIIPHPFPVVPEGRSLIEMKLAEDLNKIKKVKGKFKWEGEAQKKYIYTYQEEFHNQITEEKKKNVKRFMVTVLKLAMVYSVARDDSMIITEEDFDRAYITKKKTDKGISVIEESIYMTEYGSKIDEVFKIIKESGKISHSDLLRKVAHKISLKDFNEGIKTLAEAEKIKIEIVHIAKKPSKNYLYWKE